MTSVLPSNVFALDCIHEGYGKMTVGPTRFINASICTVGYEPTNPVIVVDL
jgi:hypothetical protein